VIGKLLGNLPFSLWKFVLSISSQILSRSVTQNHSGALGNTCEIRSNVCDIAVWAAYPPPHTLTNGILDISFIIIRYIELWQDERANIWITLPLCVTNLPKLHSIVLQNENYQSRKFNQVRFIGQEMFEHVPKPSFLNVHHTKYCLISCEIDFQKLGRLKSHKREKTG